MSESTDLTLALIERLYEAPGAYAIHIGEVVPHGTAYPFIWLMRSGEAYDTEDLCLATTPDTVTIDVEIVSDDIDEARLWTARMKNHIRTTELHSVTFQNEAETDQTVQAFDVDDHDDDYQPQSVDGDEKVFVGALNVTAILGS